MPTRIDWTDEIGRKAVEEARAIAEYEARAEEREARDKAIRRLNYRVKMFDDGLIADWAREDSDAVELLLREVGEWRGKE